MNNLTKQEKIVIALMRGQHLEPNERAIAAKQLEILKLTLKTFVK